MTTGIYTLLSFALGGVATFAIVSWIQWRNSAAWHSQQREEMGERLIRTEMEYVPFGPWDLFPRPEWYDAQSERVQVGHYFARERWRQEHGLS